MGGGNYGKTANINGILGISKAQEKILAFADHHHIAPAGPSNSIHRKFRRGPVYLYSILTYSNMRWHI